MKDKVRFSFVNVFFWNPSFLNSFIFCVNKMVNNVLCSCIQTFICEEHEDYRNDLVLDHLKALRRIYIDREENQLIAKLFHSEADRLVLRVGSLIFNHIGQLLPEQLKAFHNSDHIFPVSLCSELC